MYQIQIQIGDKVYDTGSFISTDTPLGDDWQMVAMMVSDFVNSIMFAEEEESNNADD